MEKLAVDNVPDLALDKGGTPGLSGNAFASEINKAKEGPAMDSGEFKHKRAARMEKAQVNG